MYQLTPSPHYSQTSQDNSTYKATAVYNTAERQRETTNGVTAWRLQTMHLVVLILATSYRPIAPPSVPPCCSMYRPRCSVVGQQRAAGGGGGGGRRYIDRTSRKSGVCSELISRY